MSQHGREAFIHHHNTSTHASFATRAVIEQLNFAVMLDPPYSLDLAPCDFHLMAQLKHDLRENHYYLKNSKLL
jgi:hypothetical protein